jgi:hypothetical protein
MRGRIVNSIKKALGLPTPLSKEDVETAAVDVHIDRMERDMRRVTDILGERQALMTKSTMPNSPPTHRRPNVDHKS